MLNLQRIIFNFVFDLRCFERMKFIYLLCVCFVEFCILAKQRIDSGFFLFQAAEKKKKEKKKRMMAIKKVRDNILSSDDESV